MDSMTSDVQTVTLDGKRFVIMPEADFQRFVADRVGEGLPTADKKGNRSAVTAMRAVIARDIVRDRQKLGWSQAELARRAGIRVETLNRLEGGKHSPSVATIQKIDDAFQSANAKPSRKKVTKR
jgi:ribosome-binding protein aMBF1 (putative translation factor)